MNKNIKSRVKGLQENARQKHKATLLRAKKTLEEMIKTGESITFSGFSRMAKVSPAWLYRQKEIRRKIEFLREQQKNKIVNEMGKRSYKEPSNTQYLKKRIKFISEENKALKKQLESVYGELYKLQNLKEK